MWGPVVLNQVLEDKIFDSCQPDIDRPPRVPKERSAQHKQPEDPDRREQEAFHAELEFTYRYKSDDDIDADGRVTIWTDGSEKTVAAGQKSGAGIFYGLNNPKNRIIQVNGDNDRAELAAFVHCLDNEHRPMHVRTDSRYVADGVREWRHTWRSKAWFRRPLQALPVTNVDLCKKKPTGYST